MDTHTLSLSLALSLSLFLSFSDSHSPYCLNMTASSSVTAHSKHKIIVSYLCASSVCRGGGVGAQILKAPRNPIQWYGTLNHWRRAGNKTKVGEKKGRHKSAVFQRERKANEREMCLRGKQNIRSLGRDDKEDRADRARRKGVISGRQKTKGWETYCQRGRPSCATLCRRGPRRDSLWPRLGRVGCAGAAARSSPCREGGPANTAPIYLCMCICMCTREHT